MTNLELSYHNGIEGCCVLDSKIPGPHIVISCLTHGGEVSGLQVIEFLIKNIHIASILKKGKITFLISNISAYKKFKITKDMSQSRFVDENMNRCATVTNIAHGNTSEAYRLREISPILEKADIHIDIHSTSQSEKSMAIYSSKSIGIFKNIINVDEQYSDITKYQLGKPLIDICEHNGGIGLGLELGKEGDPNTFYSGIENILSILIFYEMIHNTDKYSCSKKENIHLKITGSIIVADSENFVLKSGFQHRDQVNIGSIIAYQNGEAILAPYDCMIIMPSKVVISGEEYCFLAIST